MDRVVSTSEARANFSQLVAEAGYGGRDTIIERNQRPIAVIVGYEKYQEFVAFQKRAAEREARFAVYERIRSRNRQVTEDQVAEDVAAAIDAVRANKP